MRLGGLQLPDVCQNIGAERINTEKPPEPPVARTEKSAIARDLAVLPLSLGREGRGERSGRWEEGLLLTLPFVFDFS